jgi:hypothetical protein
VQPTAGDREELAREIAAAAELLPGQGPITAFAFVNTLQAFEGLPFDEGLKQGSRLYHCQPYLPEERYRRELASGRIRQVDLVEILLEDLGERADQLLGRLGTRFHLRLAMLEHPLRIAPVAELRWVIAETDALVRFRPETAPKIRRQILAESRRWWHDYTAGSIPESPAISGLLKPLLRRFGDPRQAVWDDDRWEEFTLNLLWEICRHGVHGVPVVEDHRSSRLRPRDVLLELTGQDADLLVHEPLIRFCAAYLDQGQSDWPMPRNQDRMWAAWQAHCARPGWITPRWLKPLAAEFARYRDQGLEPLDVIHECLHDFGVPVTKRSEFLGESLLALRGWAGMVWQMETRPDRVPFPVDAGTLIEFLAIRLTMDRLAARHVAQAALGDRGPLAELAARHARRLPKHHVLEPEQRAFLVFQLAQVRGWHPDTLLELQKSEWRLLVEELEAFGGIERRRVYHHAYERSYQTRALDAFAIRAKLPLAVPHQPVFQAMFCIDAREESFRRHLEDVEPLAETFGNAGFFNVPIQYRGSTDAHYVTLCPIVVRPQQWIVEEVAFTEEEIHRRRALVRRALGAASHQFQVGSRSFAGGAVLSAGLGVLATIPMVMSVLFPRWTHRLGALARTWMLAPPRSTRLRLQRSHDQPGPNGEQIGLSLDEMTAMGERALRDTGLTKRFARLVFIFGHGSECLNNPHKSAYDCGACSGNAGGPNARALATILNDIRVRDRLRQRGIEIPIETIFVGGLHNTCNDTLDYFDLDLLPTTHLNDFRGARVSLEQACARNAHERCRRFAAAPLDLSFDQALRLVEQRAEDLAETRPEYGNCTNALCVVGRRGMTRGLYLDRRSFLMSYDPTQDDAESTILGRILGAVVVVCSGINLQYTLSHIDSAGWGCGTKLPHNVTSLLGVMDGAASDLRPGLPWQGVDIHEPMRLTFVIECLPAALEQVMSRNETVRKIITNGWVHVALVDPETRELSVYRQGGYVPYHPATAALPEVERWGAWYQGRRDHLGFALCGAAVRLEGTP